MHQEQVLGNYKHLLGWKKPSEKGLCRFLLVKKIGDQ
jgi:hypothetical protein